MRQGFGNAEACRVVGVARKTGHRWRYGRLVTTRTGETRTYPAITRPANPVAARFLSETERISIADALIGGRSIRAIANELGRAPSTISREIRRNRDAATEAYHPFRAQRRAAGRRVRPRSGKLVRNRELRVKIAVLPRYLRLTGWLSSGALKTSNVKAWLSIFWRSRFLSVGWRALFQWPQFVYQIPFSSS